MTVLKFVENVKYNLNKEKMSENKQNNADNMQCLITMLSKSHPLQIIQFSGKPPNVICYTDNQLKHFSAASKSSVIGVDRTFRLQLMEHSILVPVL